MNNILSIVKKIKLIQILVLVCFCFIFYLVYCMLNYDYLNGDVLFEGIPVSWEKFYKPIHGRYFSEILQRFIGFANIWGIHPMDYINSYGALIKAVIWAWICYIITCSMYIGRKKDILFPLYMLLCFFVTLMINCIEYNNNTQFFGYSAMLVLLFLSWLLVIEYFIEKKIPTERKEIVKISILAFLLGMSTMYMDVSFLFLIILLFVYNFFTFIYRDKLSFREGLNKIKNLGKGIYIPLGMFFISFFAAYMNPFFWQHAARDKHIFLTVDFFKECLDVFQEFLTQFYIYIINYNSSYLIFILLMLLMISLRRNDREYRFINIISFILLSSLLFYLFLGIFGKTNYDGGFWLGHTGLTKVLKTSLIFIVFCVFGEFWSSLNLSRNKKLILQIVIIALIFVFPNVRENIKASYSYYIKILPSEYKAIRTTWYKLDYMTLFFIYKDKDIYIPVSSIKELQNTNYFLSYEDRNMSPEEILDSNDISLNHYIYYLMLSYKIPDTVQIRDIHITSDEEAYKKFNELGGTFDDEELEKLKFGIIKKKTVSLFEK